mgnify:FL=1
MKTLKQLTRSVLACLLCIGLLYSIPTIAYADVDWPQVTDFSIQEKSIECTDLKRNPFTANSTKDTVYTTDVTSKKNMGNAVPRLIKEYRILNYSALEIDSAGNKIAGEIRLYAKEKVTDNSVYIWQKSWHADVTKGEAACIQGKTASGKPSTYSISLKSENNYVNSNTFYVEDSGVKYYYKVMLFNPFEITQFEEPYRISETAAEIKINTKEAASCYYAVVDSGAAAPKIDTSGTGIPLRVGDNSVPVTLTAGAKDVYVAAKNEDGIIKTLKIEIGEALSTSTLTLYLSAYISPTFIKAEVNGKAASAETNNKVTVISDLHYNDSVKIWLQPKDTTKCISEASLVSAQRARENAALYYNPNVNSTENSITFTMPAVAALRNAINFDGTKEEDWLHYADAAVASHNLTAKVSKLWEHNPEGPSNSKGILTFTDENGAAITVAKEGSKVIAIAQPRNVSAWYEFKFVEWTEERGITISDADRTNPRLEFEMGTKDVYLFAKFENVGTNVEWGTNIPEVNNVVSVHCNSNGEVNPFVYKTGSAARFTLVAATTVGWQDAYAFDGWTILRDDNEVPENEITYEVYGKPGEVGYYTVPTVTVGGSNMKVTANFHARKIAAVTATVNDSAMGSATVAVGTGTPGTNIPAVFEGQTVTLTATPGERYMLKGWEVKDADKNDVTYTVAEDVVNVATFIMPDTGKDITAKAIFKVDPAKASPACDLSNVTLNIPGATSERSGTKYTITVPANTDEAALAQAVLKFEISKYAAVKKTGEADNWPAEGKACGMTLDQAVTFTVYSEKCLLGKDDTAKADYTVTITKAKSSEKDITAVKLLNADKSVIAEGKLNGTTWTITLPPDTDKALINKIGTSTDVFMQINYTGVSLAQAEGYDDATGIIGKWSSGNVMCGISPNSSKTFTVTAEDDSTKTYTVEIKYTAPNAPTLSGGSATRSSKTAATVKFTSSEAGNYFYKVVDHGAAVPTVDTSKNGTSAVKGENTIALSNLTEDARDIYIVVVNASRGESAALKVEIPAYGSGSETPDTGKFTITINAPKGGTITTNRTKADKGDEIIVTVKPDSGYQMVEGSLTYSLAVAGGETVKITGNRFTMPAGNVTITCKWETATTAAKGITSFSVSGVVGAVNNTTNTITITLPRGTDVTKLTPVIATNGVKSLTPGSGETVDFTNAVTYTAAMEDGSSKTYIVTVYVDKGTLADQFWDKLTDFATQVPWWEYAKHQQSTSKYPKYW